MCHSRRSPCCSHSAWTPPCPYPRHLPTDGEDVSHRLHQTHHSYHISVYKSEMLHIGAVHDQPAYCHNHQPIMDRFWNLGALFKPLNCGLVAEATILGYKDQKNQSKQPVTVSYFTLNSEEHVNKPTSAHGTNNQLLETCWCQQAVASYTGNKFHILSASDNIKLVSGYWLYIMSMGAFMQIK